MNAYAVAVLAFAMSMDAFAAAVSKGATIQKPSAVMVLRIALLFGIVEAATPLVGWAAGSVAQKYISQWDHWIAFTLLLLLGGKMVYSGLRNGGGDATALENIPFRHRFLLLLATAFATSIDSMIVGVGLAFLDVNIVATALAIGAATTLMSATGLLLGRVLGQAAGRRAEILGGLILIGIGSSILCEHMGMV